MNEFSCIGLNIDNSDEMYEFVQNYGDLADVYERDGRRYLKLSMGDYVRLWFYSKDESKLIDTSNPCIGYKSRYMIPINVLEIVSRKKEGPALVTINCIEGEIDFPANICVADGYLMDEEELLECTGAAVTCVAREFLLFEDEDDYYEQTGVEGFGAECFVPMGVMPESAARDFTPSATAMICGTVMNARRIVNPVTGLEYVAVGIECLGYMFDVVGTEELLAEQAGFLENKKNRLPEKGNILSGRYWLTGKLFK